MRKRLAIAICAGLLAVGAIGCGDDDAPIEDVAAETEETTSGSTGTEDFIVSADARCAEANAAIAGISGGTASDGTALATGEEREITEGVLDSLQSFGDPEDPEGSLQSYYDALENQISALRRQEQTVASGDTGAFSALSDELAQAKADARLAAEEFGFEDCGQKGTALSTPDSGAATTVPEATSPTVVPETTAPVPTTPAPAPAPPPVPEPAPPSGGTGTDGGGGIDTGEPPPDDGSSGGISPGG